MKTKLTLILLLIAVVSFATYNVAQSHSLGASIEKEVGEYLMDIGHNSDPIVANDQVRFEFDLQRNGELVNFSDVWVRISDGPKTIFAGNLGRPPLGPVGMTTIIPEAGEYLMSARYVQGEEEIIQATSTFSVTQNPNGNSEGSPLVNLIAIGFLGVLTGYGSAWYFRKKK